MYGTAAALAFFHTMFIGHMRVGLGGYLGTGWDRFANGVHDNGIFVNVLLLHANERGTGGTILSIARVDQADEKEHRSNEYCRRSHDNDSNFFIEINS